MKHIMRYESYSENDRLDDILDKIDKYGMSHITTIEKEFLDSFSTGKQSEVHNKIKFIENEIVFEDDYGNFKFEFKEKLEFKDENHYVGTFYVPDLVDGSKKIEGCVDGSIIYYSNGQISVDFEKDGYDILEFCEGLEYELDSFCEYVVLEIEEKMKL